MTVRCTNPDVSYAGDGNRETILRDVNLEIASGEFLAVLRPSGCGKTTFLRTIAGAIQPDRGHVEPVPLLRPRTAATTLTREFLHLKARVLRRLGVPVESAYGGEPKVHALHLTAFGVKG